MKRDNGYSMIDRTMEGYQRRLQVEDEETNHMVQMVVFIIGMLFMIGIPLVMAIKGYFDLMQ